MGAFISQCYPPKPVWDVGQTPDLTGKVMIVTGGNSGNGHETVKALLNKNATVYIACRDRGKGEAAIETLKGLTGKEARLLELDLASLDSIQNAVSEFLSKEDRLDVLFNNAGVMEPPLNLLTKEGYDLQFGTNALGPYYLTKLLIPLLSETAARTENHESRIITTSSLSHTFAPKGGVNWAVIEGAEERTTKDKKGMGGQVVYGQSKWANIVMSNELARRLADTGVVCIAVNPGNVKTNLQKAGGISGWLTEKVFLYTDPELGALTQLYAGTMPEAKDLHGKYMWPWARIGEPRSDTRGQEQADKLFEWFEVQINKHTNLS